MRSMPLREPAEVGSLGRALRAEEEAEDEVPLALLVLLTERFMLAAESGCVEVVGEVTLSGAAEGFWPADGEAGVTASRGAVELAPRSSPLSADSSALFSSSSTFSNAAPIRPFFSSLVGLS